MKHLIKKFKNNFNDMDKPLFYVTVAFFIVGLLSIVSASSRESVVRYGTSLYHYFFKQSIILLIGLFVFLVGININTKKYNFLFRAGYLLVMFLLLYLYFKGGYTNGAKNWIRLGFFSIQPGELVKPIIIIGTSVLFEKYYKFLKNDNVKHYGVIARLFLLVFIPAIIIFFCRDLGTMVITCAIFYILFILSPVPKIEKLQSTIVIFVTIVLAAIIMYCVKGYILTPAQKSRFDFINPCSNYEKGGYQVCNAYIAINDGDLFGLGIGKSKQKYSYIPEPHTDSIFAIISEELGFIFTLLLIFIPYIFILYRLLYLSSIANTIKGRYICLGTAIYIFLHLLFNLGGILGILPLTGVPLPFLSYGGSFALSLCIMLTVVQRIAIETKRRKITV